MRCPRCRNEWDVTQGPCPSCGFALSSGQGATTRRVLPPSQTAQPQQQGGFPVRQQPVTPPGDQPSGARAPLAAHPSRNPASMPGSPRSPFVQAPVTPRPAASPTVPVTPGNSGIFPPASNTPVAPNPSAKSLSQERQNSGSMPSINRMARAVPQRPQNTIATDPGATSAARPQVAPRASRLVTDPLPGNVTHLQSLRPPSSPQARRETTSAYTADVSARARATDQDQLAPGMLLRSGRYRLHEVIEKQRWLAGVYEATWTAEDAQRGGARVTVTEVVIPDTDPMVVHSTLRAATLALSSVGRHSHIPALWDAFSDHGRSFFVFETVEGESILARMRRTGHALSEREVVDCCAQMIDVLELLAQQSPPFAHGLIRPDHVIIARGGTHYILSNFSIILAGGATQFVTGMERTQLSPYTAPEFVRGSVDTRSDLFSLLATAYHAVTGSIPAGMSGSIPQPQRLNPAISAQFDAILTRGLRPVASQRYQRPSELRQDVLAMRSVSGSLVEEGRGARRLPANEPRAEVPAVQLPDSVAQVLQSLDPDADLDDQRQLLPRPEELPPLPARNDWMFSSIWIAAILVALVVLLAFSRGLM